MNAVPAASSPLTQREILVHALYEAAELEHNLMCTYLYAAFSLRDGEGEGLAAAEAAAVRRWRQVLLGVAIEEMGHLAAVWNITSALGGSPRFGRMNFPLDPGYLPASITVKLAPLCRDAAALRVPRATARLAGARGQRLRLRSPVRARHRPATPHPDGARLRHGGRFLRRPRRRRDRSSSTCDPRKPTGRWVGIAIRPRCCLSASDSAARWCVRDYLR